MPPERPDTADATQPQVNLLRCTKPDAVLSALHSDDDDDDDYGDDDDDDDEPVLMRL